MHDDKVYLPAAAVRSRYGVSDMSLWRWLRDPKLGFPRPMRINGRRFWKLTSLRRGTNPAKRKPRDVPQDTRRIDDHSAGATQKAASETIVKAPGGRGRLRSL